MFKLVIAEKPSVGVAIANVLCAKAEKAKKLRNIFVIYILNFITQKENIMSLDAISDEDFRKPLQKICQEDDWGIDKDFLNNTIEKEMNKNRLFRDYSLIHECYLTLSECYGYLYNNEFEELSEKQIERRKFVKEIKQKIGKVKTAVFY